MGHKNKEPAAKNKRVMRDETFIDPNPVFIHYDRGLQEYGDLFSDDQTPIEVAETAETESHRP